MVPLHRPNTLCSVLIVDDDVQNCSLLNHVIGRNQCFRVDATVSSFNATRAVCDPAFFDLLLVNLQLGDGQGVNVIHHVVEHVKVREILALTTTREDQVILDAIRAGASGLLLKREVNELLTTAMFHLLSGEPFISSNITPPLLKRIRVANRLAAYTVKLPSKLTPKEHELLDLVSRGLTCADAAIALGIKPSTIASYLKNIYRKLQVRSRAQATQEAVRLGLITL